MLHTEVPYSIHLFNIHNYFLQDNCNNIVNTAVMLSKIRMPAGNEVEPCKPGYARLAMSPAAIVDPDANPSRKRDSENGAAV